MIVDPRFTLGTPVRVSKNMPSNTAVLISIDGRREIVTDNANLFWVRMYAQAARFEARAHLRRIVAETEARLFGSAA